MSANLELDISEFMERLICQLCVNSWSTRVPGGFTSDRNWARNFGISKFDILLALVACVHELKVNRAQVSRKQTETDYPSQDRKQYSEDAGIHKPHVNTNCEQ